MQAFWGVKFRGRKEDIKFIDSYLENISKSIELKRYFSEKTSIEDIRRVFSSNPDELEDFILEERDYPTLNIASAEQIETFAEILGDKAPEVIEKALPMQDKKGNTVLHDVNSTPKIRTFKKILKENTDKAFLKPLLTKNDEGWLPIFESSSMCTRDKLKALIEVAPNSTKKALEQKYGYCCIPDYYTLWRYKLYKY